MGITVHPVDKVGTAPVYSGRNARQAQSPFLGGATAARPLGARSGVRPGTPSSTISLSGTTWTLGRHAGVLDVIASAEAGPYTYAVDSTGGLPFGTLNAAHGSLPRVDILSLQLSDPAESTGGNPEVVPVYTAGLPGTTTDPATPDRALTVARFNVPASGTGSPTATWIAPTTVAAGGIVPARSAAELATIAAGATSDGLLIDLGGVLWRANGTTTRPVSISEDWSTTIATGGFTQDAPLRTRAQGSEVQISGTYITRTSTTLALTAGTQALVVAAGAIPAAHRPAATVRFPGLVRYNSAPGAAEILILADGSIGVVPTGSGTLPVGTYGISIPRASWDRA